MIINTKFDIGSEVWFMKNNKPCRDIVMEIRPAKFYLNLFDTAMKSGEHCYLVGTEEFLETQLYPSKKELVESLLEE